jgi:hypothetical protein
VQALDPREDCSPQEAEAALRNAVKPLADPALRTLIVSLKASKDLVIDTVTQDRVLEAGFSQAARERAQGIVQSFEAFIAQHRDEITALQILYNRPTKTGGAPLKFEDLKALAETLQAPPHLWTESQLWQAYAALDAEALALGKSPAPPGHWEFELKDGTAVVLVRTRAEMGNVTREPGWLDGEWWQIGLRKVAIVVRVLFRTHRVGSFARLIPAARLLGDRPARFEDFGLARDLVGDRLLHRTEGVHVLHLGSRAERCIFAWANRHIRLNAHLPVLHLGIGGSDRAQ